MKTNQNLIRKMGEFDVIQRTSDGYFDANALLSFWNKTEGNKRRRMDDFLNSSNTNEFITALLEEESQRRNFATPEYQLVIRGRAKTDKTGKKSAANIWMHPYLFIKFAMWINPRFEVKVIKFVYDQLIQYRNDAGDSYKEMASAICKIVPKGEQAKAIKEISMANNHIVYGTHEKEIRNKQAEESKIKQLDELQTDIVKLITDGFISNYDSLLNYLRRKWTQKHQPKFITAQA